jgi:hypothetical protein
MGMVASLRLTGVRREVEAKEYIRQSFNAPALPESSAEQAG